MNEIDPHVREWLKTENQTGLTKILGLRFGELSGSLVTAELDVKPELLQPQGIVHGGTYAAIVETLGSYGGMFALRQPGYVVGVHNGTNFLRPTREGILSAKAIPIFQGKSQQLWQVDIANDSGKLAATGQLRVHNIYTDPNQEK